jgi:protein SCO1
MKRLFFCAVLLVAGPAWAAQQYAVAGMVLKVDQAHKAFTVSCQSIPGYMEAMIMPFEVREAKELDGLKPGMAVEFRLVVEKESSYAEHVRIRPYESGEQDPLTARRLKFLNSLSTSSASSAKALAIGQSVPDFTLIDQVRQPISLGQFSGKVITLNFIYTSCALPNFCFRMSNNFGVLQRRFKAQLGRDLELLTVTFDPQRDQPEVLARYAQTWRADPQTWHFLTGTVPEVRRVTDLFGMDFFPEEGLMSHSLHTAVIDRRGRLVANIEGNQFTADQLGDLVETVLNQPRNGTTKAPAHAAGQAGPGPSSGR